MEHGLIPYVYRLALLALLAAGLGLLPDRLPVVKIRPKVVVQRSKAALLRLAKGVVRNL